MSDGGPPDPAQLLTEARGGQSAALGVLLQLYRNYLHLLARTQIDLHLQGRVSPSDVLQETFLQACGSFGQFRGNSEKELLAWLRRLLVNNLARLVEKQLRAQKRDARREVLGTPRYMSPEQASAQGGVVDHRTDIYSLGATLYELLTLEPAFPGRERRSLQRQVASDEPRTPRQINKAIPADLETIVLKAMAKEPGSRYPSASALAEDLQRFLAGEPIHARSVSHVERAWRRCKRNPVVSALLAAVVLVTAVGLMGVLSQWQVAMASERKALANEQKAVENEQKASASAAQAQEEAQEWPATSVWTVQHIVTHLAARHGLGDSRDWMG